MDLTDAIKKSLENLGFYIVAPYFDENDTEEWKAEFKNTLIMEKDDFRIYFEDEHITVFKGSEKIVRGAEVNNIEYMENLIRSTKIKI